MSRINPVTRRTAMLAALAACVALPQAATAEDNNRRRVSIAVAEFSENSQSGDVSARELTDIVVSDLKASARLTLIDPQGLAEDDINVVPHFDRWRGIHAQGLVTGRIVRQPNHIMVEFHLWDVAIGQQLAGAQYALQPDDWRRVPHAIADAILERLVGRG